MINEHDFKTQPVILSTADDAFFKQLSRQLPATKTELLRAALAARLQEWRDAPTASIVSPPDLVRQHVARTAPTDDQSSVMRSAYISIPEDTLIRQLCSELDVTRTELIRVAVATKFQEWKESSNPDIVHEHLEASRLMEVRDYSPVHAAVFRELLA